MWTAYLSITDNNENINCDIIYKFKKCFKYEDLYKELPKILKVVGNIKLKYKKSEVKFEFFYSNKKCFVDDWKKYLLNMDRIFITIESHPDVYYLKNSIDKSIISSSMEIKNLYSYYFSNKFNYPVLLCCEDRLIDVLDNPDNYVNNCIKNLMKYGY